MEKIEFFDIPTSENAMTGIGIGACVFGLKVVMTHQRLDFALLSMDQLVNNAAKWRFMFGNKSSVSLTIRMIIGRGWGQKIQLIHRVCSQFFRTYPWIESSYAFFTK